MDSDCVFGDPDYAVPPPLAMVEGLQHVRMMEGVSRSLPSSPLLAHQHAGARLQPGRKIVGTGTPLCTMHSGTLRVFFFRVGEEDVEARGKEVCRSGIAFWDVEFQQGEERGQVVNE